MKSFGFLIVLMLSMGSNVRAQSLCIDDSRGSGVWARPLAEAWGAQARSGTPARVFEASGEANGDSWAAVRETLMIPKEALLIALSAHEVTRNHRTSDMNISRYDDPRYWLSQRVSFAVKPMPFVTVRWTEQWNFVDHLSYGSPGRPLGSPPDSTWVSYEKVEGTSYIRHLCGKYELVSLASDQTDVFIYEESNATGRTREDILTDLRGVLNRLEDTPRPSKIAQP